MRKKINKIEIVMFGFLNLLEVSGFFRVDLAIE